jgi:VanW like protein
MYGSCRRKNYLLALGHLDRTILQPGKKLVFNQLIADDPNYCGAETGKFRFYQGVCGASTMLFRNTLTNPVIDIEKRQNHNHRYTNFYGGTRGDDAAIYEMSKLFVIKNVSKNPVYFRVLRDRHDNPIVFSLTPRRSEYISIIKQHF